MFKKTIYVYKNPLWQVKLVAIIGQKICSAQVTLNLGKTVYFCNGDTWNVEMFL